MNGEHLFYLFRLEFLRQYPLALSSDALSGWGSDKANEHDTEVQNGARSRIAGQAAKE